MKLIHLLILLVIAAAGGFIASRVWLPDAAAALGHLLQTQDQGDGDKIASKGGAQTTEAVIGSSNRSDKIKSSVAHATSAIRTSPATEVVVPDDDVNRLRTSDHELCQLGVKCVDTTAGVDPTRSTPASPPVNDEGNVRVVRPSSG